MKIEVPEIPPQGIAEVTGVEKKLMYRTEDCGIFIGELTLPYDDGKTFYKKNIETLFDGYHQELKGVGVDYSDEEKDIFYKPSPYLILGNYDLAVISIIDDFHFGTKYFHPHSYLNKTTTTSAIEDGGFNYHITKGTTSIINDNEYLIPTAKKTFLKKKEKYPFIGICNVKIKNSLLIGVGYELVYLAISSLQHLLFRFKKNNPDFDYLIFEPLEWNEISVLFFSTSMKTISDAILIIREMNLSYAFANCESDYSENINSLRHKITENSLLVTKLYSEDEDSFKTHYKSEKDAKILESHIFSHTFSNLGISTEWLENSEKAKGKTNGIIKCPDFLNATVDESFYAFTRWYIKPHYLENFLTTQGIEEFNLIIGNGDVELSRVAAPFGELLEQLTKFHTTNAHVADPEMADAVRKMKTIPKFHYSKESVDTLLGQYGLSKDDGKSEIQLYRSMSKKLGEFAFSRPQVNKIRTDLIKLKVSKSLRERIINAYINYNDGIQDPILYSSFIELRDFMEWFQLTIQSDAEVEDQFDSFLRHEKYDKLVLNFDEAYSAIIVHSYRLYGISDFNLDYNGGIDPMLSGFDALFKAFRNEFQYYFQPEKATKKGLHYEPCFTVVTGMPGIESSHYVVRVNYNHLFNPEFFLSSLPKEAINYHFQGIGNRYKPLPEEQNIVFLYRNDRIDEAELKLKNLAHHSKLPASICFYLLAKAPQAVLGEFKRKILRQIRLETDAKFKMLMLEYLETINIKIIYYFIEDKFVSNIHTMNLYHRWQWINYVQSGDGYNRDFTLDETKLFRILLRQAVDNQELASKNQYARFSEVHKVQAGYHIDAINRFAQIILDVEFLPGLNLKDLRELGNRVYIGLDEERNKGNQEREDESQRLHVRIQLTEKFRTALEAGKSTLINIDNNFDSIRVLINAYLDIVAGFMPKENIVLRRDEVTGDIDKDYIKNHPEIKDFILLDPVGGTFTFAPTIRRKYFRLRNTIFKTLFNFSLQKKVKLFHIDVDKP